MELNFYINHIVDSTNVTHDVFYTNPKVIASFLETIVNRYKNSPNIFAWELVNEARCLGDLPAGPNCVPGINTIYNWYRQQSDYVRSLDPYHSITTGGEDRLFEIVSQNISRIIPALISPSRLGEKSGFQITRQARWSLAYPLANSLTATSAAKIANKPVILEDFGVTGLGKTKYERRINCMIFGF
ncbi:hypothetical protein C0993_008536 [Termitomyces sp. T159_Od127]|nr:hypothetical protein C0993_008536 [Termitomyces sp. T159_Od127]